SINTSASIIFTVSPVRHVKDGFVENTQSKAHLISALHELIKKQSLAINQQSFYFPSYELMMDELRDYRFYAEDMIHPNQTAISYIWQAFKEDWMSDHVLKTMDEVDAIQKSFKHKAFNPSSEAYQLFLQKLSKRVEQLQLQFPHIMLSFLLFFQHFTFILKYTCFVVLIANSLNCNFRILLTSKIFQQ